MRRALLGACLLLGCARTAAQGPATEAPPDPDAVAGVDPAPSPNDRAEPSSPVEPAIDPVAEALARFEAAGVKLDGSLYDAEVEQLAQAGLTAAQATAALEVLAERCKDQRTPVCGHSGEQKSLREALVDWLRDRGDLSSAPTLLRLDHHGDYMAGLALDDALTRRMQATLGPCAAPSAAEIAAARAELPSFVVLDQRRGHLVGRAATEAELDDLAYFLAAVADNGAPVGEHVDTLRTGVTLTEAEQTERTQHLETLQHAVAAGDTALTVQAGSDYLHTLGYPGPIDLSREVDMAWGGARFSYVMRDVARAAELEGDPALAAALYRRANPGGGACGTSVSSRATDQILGVIRSEEAQGRCRAVVVERLTDREGGRGDSPYGPERLAAAGFDLERLYRGALLTRHREHDRVQVEAAIDRAPPAVREAGLARLAARGPEAWESRVWAVEGLADEGGRRGVEQLLPLLHRADPQLRARLISAIGRGASRPFSGACDPDRLWLGGSWSSLWSRPVGSFGHDCSTWLTDAEADAMARKLLPHLDATTPEVRTITAVALGQLAAPSARRPLRRAFRRAQAAEQRCKAKDPDECWDLGHEAQTAAEALEALARSVPGADADDTDDTDDADDADGGE